MTGHGEFTWNELNTHDPQRAMAFYAETIGWTFQGEAMPGGGTYWLIIASGKPVGGIFTLAGPQSEGARDHWLTYIAVDDIDMRVDKARAAGAAIMREPWDVPGVGRVALIREPGGALIGWVTPDYRG